MTTFALKHMDAIRGRQRFDKLLVNGIAPFDVFERGLTKADKRSLEKIYFYMNEVANNKSLPKTKFRDVTPDKERVKEYEFKDGKTRVYGISSFGGKIIIMGGYKNRQTKDFRAFRSLKGQYLKQQLQTR